MPVDPVTPSQLRVAAFAVAFSGAAPAFGGPSRPERWAPGETIPVWMENVHVPPEHLDMVRRALATWAKASEGALVFRETPEFPPTGIRVRFVTGDIHFGETMPSTDHDSGWIVRADVVLSVDSPGDVLQKRLVLYLTALHEVGHALGLRHTDEFNAIMFRFRSPADPPRYFLRYRKALRSVEDIGREGASGLYPADHLALRKLYGP